jgi:hypothetical protein
MFIFKVFILFMLDNHIFDVANCDQRGAGKRPESRQISTANPRVHDGLGALEYSGGFAIGVADDRGLPRIAGNNPAIAKGQTFWSRRR